MPLSITCAGVKRLLFIGFGIEPQSNAHLIEGHVDLVGMNLDFCDYGEGKRTQVLRIEILPAGGKPRSLVEKRLLCDGVRPTALDSVQHDDRISEPCAYPASNESLDMSGRNALAPLRCLIVSSQ